MDISGKISRYRWGKAVLDELRAELERAAESGLDIPAEPGGWWHQYVCPEHHTELLFDPLEKNADVFRCPYGCTLEGEPYRGAWLVFRHQALARFALQAAAVYAATGERRYAEWSLGILRGYAVRYPGYPIHPDSQPWMLKGRAFHQALTEAIWATTLMRAHLLLADQGVRLADECAEADLFYSMLEESMSRSHRILVEERNTPESNYTAWLNAALACLGAVRNDRAKLLRVLDGEGGFKHHLSVGVRPDQLEYEGSVYYHVFVLRAYLIVAEMAERFGIDVFRIAGERGQSLEGMFDVLALLANDRGELPSLHDGPYRRLPYAREIAEIFEIGLSRFKNKAYVPILAEAYRQMSGERRRTGLEALLYGEGEWDFEAGFPPRPSLLLPDSGFVVGRQAGNALSFCADFGPHGGSHGHYDKLHLSLEHRDGTVAPDFGMVPYGSRLRKDWYAATFSHNTVVVDGRSHKAHAGQCVKYESRDGWTYAWLRSEGAYDRTVLNRHLLLTPEWLLDWFEVECGQERQIDWLMHSLGWRAVPGEDGWMSCERTPDEPALGEQRGEQTYGERMFDAQTSGERAPGLGEPIGVLREAARWSGAEANGAVCRAILRARKERKSRCRRSFFRLLSWRRRHRPGRRMIRRAPRRAWCIGRKRGRPILSPSTGPVRRRRGWSGAARTVPAASGSIFPRPEFGAARCGRTGDCPSRR